MSVRLRAAFVVIAAALAVGGMALAQRGGAQRGGAQRGEESDSGDAEAAIEVRRGADLTPEDQIAEGQRILSNGQGLSTRIQGMLDQARREHDMVRVNCLDDKLTQVNAHLRTLGDRVASLQESVRLGDEARRNHEYTVVTVLGQNLVQLDRDASGCVGQDLYETGTTRVVTTIAPGTPDIDPTNVQAVPTETVPFIPPPASGAI